MKTKTAKDKDVKDQMGRQVVRSGLLPQDPG